MVYLNSQFDQSCLGALACGRPAGEHACHEQLYCPRNNLSLFEGLTEFYTFFKSGAQISIVSILPARGGVNQLDQHQPARSAPVAEWSLISEFELRLGP
eukprot:gene4421-biopygen12591